MNPLPQLQTLLPKENRLKSTKSQPSGAASIKFGAPLGAAPVPPLSEDQFMIELRGLLNRLAPDKNIKPQAANKLDARTLDDTSLLMTFDVSLTACDGQEIRVQGQSVLDNILAASALTEAPDMLQSVHYTQLWRPLRVKTMDFLQNRMRSPRRLPYSEGSLSDYDANITPPIPAGRQYTGANPTSLSAEPGEA